MIRRALYNLFRWASNYNEIQGNIKLPRDQLVSVSNDVEIEGMRFTLMRANGGIVLQSRTYDRRKDEHSNNTYIITDEEPLAERIGQIVSLEMLKS